MKRSTLATIAAAMMLLASSAFAQAGNTASGTLTVSAVVNSSINLVFQKDAAGAAIAGAGTSQATLDFGTITAFGAAPAGSQISAGTSNFTLTSLVDVVVNAANSSSANYRLTAQLQSAPTNGESLTVNLVPVTSGGAAIINGTAAYGTTAATIALTIPFTVPSGTTVSDVIDFTATSN